MERASCSRAPRAPKPVPKRRLMRQRPRGVRAAERLAQGLVERGRPLEAVVRLVDEAYPALEFDREMLERWIRANGWQVRNLDDLERMRLRRAEEELRSRRESRHEAEWWTWME